MSTDASGMAVSPAECRLALFVDDLGLVQVLPYLHGLSISAIVAASIRPKAIEFLREYAHALGCPLLVQPRWGDANLDAFLHAFRAASPTVILSHSYSMIIRPEMLAAVDYRAINVHAALLPKNRGPNPVQWALIHDEKKTGVTIHYLADGLDTGAIISQREVAITLVDTWVTLQKKITVVMHDLFRDTVRDAILGRLSAQVQAENLATRNSRLTADSPRLDLNRMNDLEIFNWIRAQVAPLKGAFVQRGEERRYIDQYVPLAKIPALRESLLFWMSS